MAVILKTGSKGEEVVLLQKALNELGGASLSKDGDFGNGTANVLKAWQKNNNFIADGIYNEQIHTQISELIERKYIRLETVADYAIAIGVEPNFLKAVAVVEAKSSGFFNNGSCVILFERHIFYNQAVRKFGKKMADKWAASYSNLCYPAWTQSAYLGGVREWDRLDAAKNLDPECALLAVSWGMFQVMGFNHALCGYNNVGDFVADMVESEKYQIGATSMLIRNQQSWWEAAVNKNFTEFARLYNGPGYAQHKYHIRLEDAYDTFVLEDENRGV